MLTDKQIQEIKEHLEKAQNPLFFYDNDADGLCAFVLLRRLIGRGKGIAIRSYPELDKSYAQRAQDLNADYVFVLDKPVLSLDFVKKIDELNLPLVWIDHHDMPNQEFPEFKNFHLYNPARNKGKDKSDEPVSYLAYKIAGKKEDLWISLMGCISDHFLPDFAEDFAKEYPELWGKDIKAPFQAYFKTEIGKIADALNFGLKDSMTNIILLQNYFIACKTPNDVLAESSRNVTLRKKYQDIKKKYNSLLEKAKELSNEKMIFFEYSGELSISSNLANELNFLYPKKYIVVAFKKGAVSNISMRGKNVKAILDKILKQLEHASGGGHEDAVGARIKLEDLGKFRELMEKEI